MSCANLMASVKHKESSSNSDNKETTEIINDDERGADMMSCENLRIHEIESLSRTKVSIHEPHGMMSFSKNPKENTCKGLPDHESVPDSEEPTRDVECDELEASEVEELCALPTSPVGDASMELEAIATAKERKESKSHIVPMYIATASNKGRVPF